MTAAQEQVADRIAQAIGALRGPFIAWIRCPELAARLYALADFFLRSKTALPKELGLLAILVTIRHWGAAFPWSVQVPRALAAGIEPSVIAAIGAGETPSFAMPDAAIVHRLARELLGTRAISDATYREARDLLGQAALVELVGAIGYFSTVSLTAAAFDITPPEPS
jgi:4-carboxymuconolactone decarboxylase